MQKSRFSLLVCPIVLSLVLNGTLVVMATEKYQNLTAVESQIINRINGTSAYSYDLELERIGLNHTLSGYSFRSSGSSGSHASAEWIQKQFESFGLETSMESFEFKSWDLPTEPGLTVDQDGNRSTTEDDIIMGSFQAEHYSWPTPANGVYTNIVTLPLPAVRNRQAMTRQNYDAAAWNAVNTTGKILLIGREVRWSSAFHLAFRNKIQTQPPVAVIFTWWNDWMSWVPPSLNSIGGLPISDLGPYLWDFKIPSGWVDYQEGILLRNRISSNISALVSIPAVIGNGPHENVIGKLLGSSDPQKTIILSGHYDTVTDAGFCDNGAGIAGVLELARVFSQAYKENLYRPEHSILFVAFAGEELGFVGSIDYMKRHAAERNNIEAVINLDCIGSDILEISETLPDDRGLDLKGIVTKAATDLGLAVRVTDPGGSDQEAFRNPLETDDLFKSIWGVDAGIRNLTRVKSSIMVDSYPLFTSDQSDGGKPGWIHTPFDNSTSTAAFGWVQPSRLESHIQVVAFSVLRVLSTILSPFLLEVYGITAAVAIVAVSIAFFQRSKLRPFLSRARKEVLAHIGLKELIYILGLTAIFIFASFALHSSLGKTEIIDQKGYSTIVTVQYFGTPLEMFGIPTPIAGGISESPNGMPEVVPTETGGVIMLWQGFLLNLALCFFLAFVLTYSIVKIKYLREIR